MSVTSSPSISWSDPERSEALIKQSREALEAEFGGRLWIVAFPVLVAAEAIAKQLISLGAERVLAVGVTEGVRGSAEPEPCAELERLCLHGDLLGLDYMNGIRGAERLLDQLNEEQLAQVERFDPQGEALVIRVIFSESDSFAGRRVYGARRASWMALEDKLIIDALWDEVGIKRSPSMKSKLSLSELIEAAELLDRGYGVVIAGDNRSGYHGGAARTRWARGPKQLNRIAQELSKECDEARVMPYLKGVSCSIHGWVFPQGQLSLRPCEMLVYESEETCFEYLGAAIHWRPNDRVKAQMIEAAERVARHLKEQLDYRGVFTIDGIADEERFYPTELNPRFGGAIARMALITPQLPLLLMHYATIEGALSALDIQGLRGLILEASELSSSIRPSQGLKAPCERQEEAHFVYRDEAWRRCEAELEGASVVRWGPAQLGSMLIVTAAQSSFEDGAPTLPRCLTLLEAAQEHFVGSRLAQEGAASDAGASSAEEVAGEDQVEEDQDEATPRSKPKVIRLS